MQVDENTASTLPSNFFVNNLLATMAITNDKPNARKMLCDNCDSEDTVKNRCIECAMFLCQFCTESHKRSRSTKRHKILTIEELKSERGPQKVAEKVRCSKHEDEVTKLFCKTCQTTICRDCIIVDHRDHKYEFVKDVAVEEKQKMIQNLDKVKQRKCKVAQGVVALNEFNERLETMKNSTILEINEHFNELTKAVELRKTEMVDKAVSIANSKQKQIQAQLEALEVALASCESSIEFTEQAFKNGDDTQILSMEKYILQSLEQLQTVSDQIDPCVTENMIFFIPPSVQETKKMLLRDYVVDVPVVSPENCHSAFKEQKARCFRAGDRYSIELICSDEHNRGLKGQVIEPSFTGMEVSDVVINDNKNGAYVISFCPRHDGMLKFDVSINGNPVPRLSLQKEVQWELSRVHGNAIVSSYGLYSCREMSGSGNKFCWRVGDCYFTSGVHKWGVRLKYKTRSKKKNSKYSKCEPIVKEVNPSVKIGIIDYDEVIEGGTTCKKWVHSFDDYCRRDLSLTLCMESKTLDICGCYISMDSMDTTFIHLLSCRFTADRVSPFFACNSSDVSITVLKNNTEDTENWK